MVAKNDQRSVQFEGNSGRPINSIRNLQKAANRHRRYLRGNQEVYPARGDSLKPRIKHLQKRGNKAKAVTRTPTPAIRFFAAVEKFADRASDTARSLRKLADGLPMIAKALRGGG